MRDRRKGDFSCVISFWGVSFTFFFKTTNFYPPNIFILFLTFFPKVTYDLLYLHNHLDSRTIFHQAILIRFI